MGILRTIYNILRGQEIRLTDGERAFYNVKSPMQMPLCGETARTYYLEIHSECNLRCPMCSASYRHLFCRKQGSMSWGTLIKILDKIQKDSPGATVSPYMICEPLIYPNILGVIKEIKKRGLRCSISTNLMFLPNPKALVESGVDEITVSVSGFYQATYAQFHTGGDIEQVKCNLRTLRAAMSSNAIPVLVMYHMYRSNVDSEMDRMNHFVDSLGFKFQSFWGRSVSIELSLKYFRAKGFNRYFGILPEWFDNLALPDKFMEIMGQTLHRPEDCFSYPILKKCPMNRTIIGINHEGKVRLCCGTYDDRLLIGDFLTLSMPDIWAIRRSHPVCQECLTNGFVYYDNYYDMDAIDKKARSRLPRSLRHRGFK